MTAVATMEPEFLYTCENCSDTGYESVTVERGEFDAVRPCKGADRTGCPWKDAQRGGVPGLPKEETDSRLANFVLTDDNGDALKQAQYFLAGVHPGLYLWGKVGTGKTRLACSVLNELHGQGQRVRFVRCPELLLKLMPGFDETDVIWTQVVEAPVVVLDDIGANQGTDFARRMMQTLYDSRLDRKHRTIFTSNLNLDDLGEFLNDDRLPSRIAGNCRIVAMKGKDWRLKRKRKAQPSNS